MRPNINLGSTAQFLKGRSTLISQKLAVLVKEGSSRKISIKKGRKTVVELPLTAGLGGATAAIFLNAPLTAAAAILALSSDISISVNKNEDTPEETDS